MKKIISTVLALTLTLSMSVTAFAADSVESSTNNSVESSTNSGTESSTNNSVESSTNEEESTEATEESTATTPGNYSAANVVAVDSEGNEVKVIVTSLSANTIAEAKQVVMKEFGTGAYVLAAADYSVEGASKSNPITLTFDVNGVNAGDTVYIMHKHSSDNKWYREDATATNGCVTATFTSFSPMVIVRAEKATEVSTENHSHTYYAVYTAAPTATTWGYTLYRCECGEEYISDYVAPLNGTTTATSPKTADNGVLGF